MNYVMHYVQLLVMFLSCAQSRAAKSRPNCSRWSQGALHVVYGVLHVVLVQCSQGDEHCRGPGIAECGLFLMCIAMDFVYLHMLTGCPPCLLPAMFLVWWFESERGCWIGIDPGAHSWLDAAAVSCNLCCAVLSPGHPSSPPGATWLMACCAI
jgi:hypothetical protein